jgi:hypothetical protein
MVQVAKSARGSPSQIRNQREKKPAVLSCFLLGFFVHLMQLQHMELLQVCNLDGCHSIIGRGLAVLEKSNQLHTLSLANCRRLQDEAIINISHLIALEHLSLDGCRCLTNRFLEALDGAASFRTMDWISSLSTQGEPSF